MKPRIKYEDFICHTSADEWNAKRKQSKYRNIKIKNMTVYFGSEYFNFDFKNVTFENVKMDTFNCMKCNFYNTNFIRCNIKSSKLENCNFLYSSLIDTNCENVNFTKNKFNGFVINDRSNLTFCSFAVSSFKFSALSGNFNKCNFRGSGFDNCTFPLVSNMCDCDLFSVIYRETIFY